MDTVATSVAGIPAHLARRALFAFLLTFAASRVLVFLIMSRRFPNLFLFLRGTHVHHLNYGIFLLAAIGAYLLFRHPQDKALERAALAYGFAMALTFDEFGMWLHLGGSYWQRASIDAVVMVAAFFALIAFAPSLGRLEARHLWAFIAVLIMLIAFGVTIIVAGNRIGSIVGPQLEELELNASP